MTKIRRYKVYIAVDELRCGDIIFRDVFMSLFKDGASKRDLANLEYIIGCYEEEYIKKFEKDNFKGSVLADLFTAQEVVDMEKFFKTFPGTNLSYEEVHFPVDNWEWGHDGVPVDRKDNYHRFEYYDRYPFKFGLYGRYRLSWDDALINHYAKEMSSGFEVVL